MAKRKSGKSQRIPSPSKPSHSSRIPEVSGPSAPLSFSFQYAILDCDKFRIDNCESQYFLKLLERLKALCNQTPKDLQRSRSKALRCHPIVWGETSEAKGFAKLLPLALKDSTPYQFSITTNKWGRVHGFFIGSRFHIVWFDVDHRLYP